MQQFSNNGFTTQLRVRLNSLYNSIKSHIPTKDSIHNLIKLLCAPEIPLQLNGQKIPKCCMFSCNISNWLQCIYLIYSLLCAFHNWKHTLLKQKIKTNLLFSIRVCSPVHKSKSNFYWIWNLKAIEDSSWFFDST